MILPDLSYECPKATYLLLLAPLFFGLLWQLARWRQKQLSKVGLLAEQPQLMIPRSRFNYWVKSIAFILSWVLATFALMQPKGNGHYPVAAPQEVRRQVHEVILLVDASASMGVKDTRTGVSRLDLAKEIADTILRELSDENAALLAFTSEATLLAPITFDLFFVRMALANLQINEGGSAGTDLIKALSDANERFSTSSSTRKRSLVLLTDGGDTRLEGLADAAREKQVAQMQKKIEQNIKPNFHLYTIGMGSSQGGLIPGIQKEAKSALDPQLLKSIGEYYYQAEDWPIFRLSHDLTERILSSGAVQKEAAEVGEHTLIYDHYYQWPLGLALLLLAVALFFPEVKEAQLPICCLFVLNSLSAQDAQTLFEQGKTYFEAGEIKEAQKFFSQLVDDEKLEEWQRATAIYDKAYLLIEQKQWQAAIEQLERIDISPSTSPLLLKQQRYNLAYARYFAAVESEQSDPLKTLSLLRQALQDSNEAEQARCRLIKLGGLDHCPEETTIRWLSEKIREKIAIILERPELISTISEGESLLLLEEGIRKMLGELDFLQQAIFPPTLQKRYLQYDMHLMQKWMPLVVYVGGIEPLFKKGIRAMAKSHWEESRQLLTELLHLLQEKESHIWQEPTLRDLLHSYQRALSQRPLQEITLLSLQRQQQPLGLQGVDDSLKFTLQLLDHQEVARLFLEDAKQQLEWMAKQAGSKGGDSSIVALETAIEKEWYALKLVRKAILIPHPSEQLLLLLPQVQQRVLEAAKNFLLEVRIQQEAKDKAVCQKTPWDQAIPLFSQGWQKAVLAGLGLQSLPSLFEVANDQDEVIKFWERALKLLKEPPKAQSAPVQEKQMQTLLRQLEQMEREDRKIRPASPISKEGQYPW